jgi:hypothetical protein
MKKDLRGIWVHVRTHTVQTGTLLTSVGKSTKCYYQLKAALYVWKVPYENKEGDNEL